MNTYVECFSLISTDKKTRYTVIKTDSLMTCVEKYNVFSNDWEFVYTPVEKPRFIVEKQWKELIAEGFTKTEVNPLRFEIKKKPVEKTISTAPKYKIDESLIPEDIKEQIEALKEQANKILDDIRYTDDHLFYMAETSRANALISKAMVIFNQYALVQVN